MKALLLSLMIMAGLVLPVRAQHNDAFFHQNEEYEDRDEGSGAFNLANQHFGDSENGGFDLYNQQFGADVPLGGGLLIVLGAGVCYAAIKRKRP